MKRLLMCVIFSLMVIICSASYCRADGIPCENCSFTIRPAQTRSQIIALVDEYVLSERNRKIVKRRLCDGIHYEPLAEEFDLSVRQVKNIVSSEVARIPCLK